MQHRIHELSLEAFFYANPPFPQELLTPSPYLNGKIKNQVKLDFISDFPQASDGAEYDFWIRGKELQRVLTDYPSEGSLEDKKQYLIREKTIRKQTHNERQNGWKKWKKTFHQNWASARETWRARIKRWEKEEEALDAVLGAGASGGGFWELPEEYWENLFLVQDFLNHDSGLKELAALLGRRQSSRQKTIRAGEGPHLPRPGREEILGLEPTGNLSQALPTEWFSLLDPQREMIFYQRWIEGKLLGYQYGIYQGESTGEEAGPFWSASTPQAP
jgi:hypothetical protein